MENGIKTWIGPAFSTAETSLRERFESAPHFPHLVLDSFLRPERCQALLREFPPFTEKNALSDTGVPGGKAVHPEMSSIGPAWKELDEFVQSEAFLGWVERVTGISGLETDPTYYGAGAHESLGGEDLDFHVDFNFHPFSGLYRRLNVLLYLNEGWEEDWGGQLLLHANPSTTMNDPLEVSPLFNRCVIMESSSRTWHAFRRVAGDRSRKSFALYLYTKGAPEDQRQPRSTVYRDWPLPEDLSDRPALMRLLNRRAQHLVRLQAENEQLLKDVARSRKGMIKLQNRLAKRMLAAKKSEDILCLAHEIDEEIQELYSLNSLARRLFESLQTRWQWLAYPGIKSGKK